MKERPLAAFLLPPARPRLAELTLNRPERIAWEDRRCSEVEVAREGRGCQWRCKETFCGMAQLDFRGVNWDWTTRLREDRRLDWTPLQGHTASRQTRIHHRRFDVATIDASVTSGAARGVQSRSGRLFEGRMKSGAGLRA